MNINQVIPIAALKDGGSVVTIEGTQFQEGAEVYFGATPATNVSLDKQGNLIATLPAAEESGIVTLTVVNPDGTNNILEDGFTYITQTTNHTEIYGISPMSIYENEATEMVMRGRYLIECYNSGVLALIRTDGSHDFRLQCNNRGY